jgi:hypothetical protein
MISTGVTPRMFISHDRSVPRCLSNVSFTRTWRGVWPGAVTYLRREGTREGRRAGWGTGDVGRALRGETVLPQLQRLTQHSVSPFLFSFKIQAYGTKTAGSRGLARGRESTSPRYAFFR